MKIYLGKYKNWFGPYQLAEKILFFIPKEIDEHGFPDTREFVHKFGEFLAYGSIKTECLDSKKLFDDDREITWLFKFLLWIESKRKRKEYIKIDRWDTWNMDHTLALIVLPMLKQLKSTKQGSFLVDLEDVPEYMRTTETEDYDDQLTLDFYKDDVNKDEKLGYDIHDRCEWVMNEMIFAFEHLVDDKWEEVYRKGKIEIISVPCSWDENGKPKLYEMKDGPNNTYECDYDGLREVYDRIDNGLKLFGKYYRGLWD